MDRRSWPWKKKSSDKTVYQKALDAVDPAGASLASVASLRDQGNCKKVNYVQVSLDSYTHLTSLEDKVTMWQNQVKDLEEQLSATKVEITAKDNLSKQHAKVAEEAVSGWEKADAEASALKHQLESVTLLKLTAEDRASLLDGALKECLRQLRVTKEEHEQELHKVVLTKTKQCDKIKVDLEAKIRELDQMLLRSAAENASLSRSLQEQSSMLLKINDEKSQVEMENELLKGNIESSDKEISSLKYELHVFSKELDIRNEEKNMSIRSAEAANKQLLDSVKKIEKLEAECQRLRGLVRKKLPGPAALAQMKREVDNWGHDFGEARPILPSPVGKNSKSILPLLPETCTDNLRPDHKETELLTKRLLTVEEETKMLKEALASRNSELQSSRDLCAKMDGRIKYLETQLQIVSQRRSSPSSIFEIPAEGSSQNASTPQSVASVSEDGFHDDGSLSESWETTSVCNLGNRKRDKGTQIPNNSVAVDSLGLMDDFLEMEQIAQISNNSDKSLNSGSSNHMRTEDVKNDASVQSTNYDGPLQVKSQCSLNPSENQVSSYLKGFGTGFEHNINEFSLKLLSRVSMVLESQNRGTDMRRVLEDVVKNVMLDLKNYVVFNLFSYYKKETHPDDGFSGLQTCPQDVEDTMKNEVLLKECVILGTAAQHGHAKNQDLVDAISHISKFVVSLKSHVMPAHDSSAIGKEFIKDYENFSASVDEFLLDKISLVDVVLDLSRTLVQASDVKFIVDCKSQEGGITISDKQCIPSRGISIPFSNSDPEILTEGNLNPRSSFKVASCKCSLEIEQLNMAKDKMEKDLARCNQDFESKKLRLEEMELLLAEARSELASSRKLNSLAETQLKCMAESYKLLEIRAAELEANVNNMQAVTETLDAMLKEEKNGHQKALARCKGLEDQMQRKMIFPACAHPTADMDIKRRQEMEIADAAAKLTECQETIYTLGKQLKALHPQTDIKESHHKDKLQIDKTSAKDGFRNPHANGFSHELDQSEMDRASSFDMRGVFDESPLHNYDSTPSPSSGEQNQRAIKSFHSSSALVLENHHHGFSRFFPKKGSSDR